MSAPRQPHVARNFADRHIGPSPQEQREMLASIGAPSMEALIAQTLPANIRMTKPLSPIAIRCSRR
jgi:glycine dehydrogenase